MCGLCQKMVAAENKSLMNHCLPSAHEKMAALLRTFDSVLKTAFWHRVVIQKNKSKFGLLSSCRIPCEDLMQTKDEEEGMLVDDNNDGLSWSSSENYSDEDHQNSNE